MTRSLILFLGISVTIGMAGPLSVLQKGQTLEDARNRKPITLNDYHPFRPIAENDWEARRAEIRLRVQVAAGLHPWPTKTPLKPVIHGKREMDGYSVEKVFFESFPGHFVTASLYLPLGDSLKFGAKGGKRPGVLCPHGHWSNGRFHDAGMAKARQQIEKGAEKFANGGRNPMQARCVQLARMGCVVLQYDMLGYADSQQLRGHRLGMRKHLNGTKPGEWGIGSPQSAARLQTTFGIQTWNSVRALDFLLTLSEVDPNRLLVTGASGGGTQTQMLAAIDDRIDAAFPCVMPSTGMQGGCTCENSYLLRIGQGNIDIAAAFAPKPQGMTSADDWTRELKTKGYPDLVKVYESSGKPNHFEAHFDIQYKHNYNWVSRTHMYEFVNRHFELGLKSPVEERDFELLSKDDLTVWDDTHPQPKGGEEHEKALLKWWTEDAAKQVVDLKAATKTIQEGIKILIGRGVPQADEVEFELVGKKPRDSYIEMSGIVHNKAHDERIPAAFLHPNEWNGTVKLWISPKGKAAIYDDKGELLKEVRESVAKGNAVMCPDLFGQGESGKVEYVKNPNSYKTKKKVDEKSMWKLSGVYFYGYNHSLYAKRVHDLLSCISFVRNHPKWETKQVHMVASQGAGHWAAGAVAICGNQVNTAQLNLGDFKFENLKDEFHDDFLPGAVKYGDIEGILSLATAKIERTK